MVIYIILLVQAGRGMAVSMTAQGWAWGREPLLAGKSEEESEEVFFKSQVSLAETCQEEQGTPRSTTADATDDDTISMRSELLEGCNHQNQCCQEFLLRGYCMNGSHCPSEHPGPSVLNDAHRRRRVTRWILKEMPELLVGKQKRVHSFLN